MTVFTLVNKGSLLSFVRIHVLDPVRRPPA
jgi:hypothetical protein